MQIRLIETNEIVNLSYGDQCDAAADIIEVATNPDFVYDEEDEIWTTTTENSEWWTEFFRNLTRAEAVATKLSEVDGEAVDRARMNSGGVDLEDQPRLFLKNLAEEFASRAGEINLDKEDRKMFEEMFEAAEADVSVTDIQIYPQSGGFGGENATFSANIAVEGLAPKKILLQYSHNIDPSTGSRWSIPDSDEMSWECDESQNSVSGTDARELAEALDEAGELSELNTIISAYDNDDTDVTSREDWFYTVL